jgi:TorA maturation chaperone TorD
MQVLPSANIAVRETAHVIPPVEEDRARGHVYALLGNLLAGPPEAKLLALLADAAPGTGDDSLLAASWRMLAVASARADLAALREEYDALFVGIGRGEVVPYGSWYLTGFLMEQPLAQLRGDLRTLGIERQPGVCEPEDHVAALCDTMALLINGDACVSIERQQIFYVRHLEPWAAQFFRDLQRAASARFYRAVGQLGEQFIDVESQAFRVGTPAAGVTTPS